MACQVAKGQSKEDLKKNKSAGAIIKRLKESTEAVLQDIEMGRYTDNALKLKQVIDNQQQVVIKEYEKVRLQLLPQLHPLLPILLPCSIHSLSPPGDRGRSRPFRPLGCKRGEAEEPAVTLQPA